MCELGYWVELSRAASGDELNVLTDKLAEESYNFRQCDDMAQKHARPLRASWIKLIEDERYAWSNDIIFCENDAIPLIDSAAMERLLKAAPQDGDVYRLNYELTYVDSNTSKLPIARFNETKWLDLADLDNIKDNRAWGTHALYIPAASRAKVAAMWKDVKLPVDDALVFAAKKGILKVYTPNVDLFLQIGERVAPQDKRFALLLSSYRRYKDMQRQIYAMMDQSYKNLTLFVAAKGIAEADVNERLIPLFQHFIDEGRLVIRSFPNSNQVTNFVDCYRDLDIDGYDLFAKIDDDDVYPRDYFERINELHRHFPNDVGSWNTWFGGFIRQQAGYPVVADRWVHYVGATLIMPRKIIDILAKYENNSNAIAEYLNDPEFASDTFGYREDYLMEQLLKRTGGVHREHWYSATQDHCSCHATASVTRRNEQDYCHYWELLRSVHENRAYEHILKCKRGNETPFYLRLVKDKAWTLDGKWTCYNVIDFNNEILVIESESKVVATFKRNDSGLFIKD